jgi:hypothetical protein
VNKLPQPFQYGDLRTHAELMAIKLKQRGINDPLELVKNAMQKGMINGPKTPGPGKVIPFPKPKAA